MEATRPAQPRRTYRITWRDPLGTEVEGWRTDPLLPAFFLAAAALILGYINPIHLGFAPQPAATLIAMLLASSLVGWGAWKGRTAYMVAGSILLIALVALCLVTQPVQLGVSSARIWPLRVLLLALVAGSWAFLLRPPLWAQRALMALAVPVGLALACSGLPLVLAQLAPPRIAAIPNTFSPYWLATDSQGRLYATSSAGGHIWAFSPEGTPLGTIRPHISPDSGTGEISFRPAGYPSPTPLVHRSGPNVGQPIVPPINFCGIAIGPRDTIYVVDQVALEVLRLDRFGAVEARFPLPETYQASRGCIATDAEHIYLGSRFGFIHVRDHGGEVIKDIEVDYQPFGIAPDRNGNVYVAAPTHIDRINIESGEIVQVPQPPIPEGGVRSPYQAILVTGSGDLIASDLANARVLRISMQDGSLVNLIGEPGTPRLGFWPGNFSGLGGLAEAKNGDIFVADWQLTTIQRFGLDGTLKDVMPGPSEVQPVPVGEENE